MEAECFSLLPVPYQSLDAGGHILTVNDEWLDKTGFNKDEVIGSWFGDFLIPEDVPHFRGRFTAFKKKGMIKECEYRLKKKDGSVMWISFNGKIEYDDEGSVQRTHCVWQDISAGKRAEEQARHGELFFRGLIENTEDWLWHVDKNGHYQYVSPNVADIMGYTPSEIVGKTPFDFMSAAEAERVGAVFSGLAKDSRPIKNLEDTMIKKDGIPVIFETNATPLFDERGALNGYIGTCSDISARQRHREEIRLYTELLETLVQLYQSSELDEAQIGNFVLESAIKQTGSSMGFINFMNEDAGYTKQYSYSRHTMEECNTDIPKTFPIKDAGLWAEAVRRRKPLIVNDYRKDKEGKKGLPEGHVPLERFLTVPVFDEGSIVLVASVANKHADYNDTDVKQLILLMDGLWKHIKQEKVKAEIRASLKEKELLLKEIHHRVKNNMQIITSLLKLQIHHTERDDFAALLSESINRIQTMALIHTQLYQHQDLAEIDLRKFVPELCERLMNLYNIDESRIDMRYNISGPKLKLDQAIPCGLILNELVSNSLKYAFDRAEHGIIEVGFRQLHEGDFQLLIRDSGKGLPEEISADTIHSMGLRIVNLLTERQLGGSIEIKNEKGTEFIITFMPEE
jgi:PAS domain S-box-containing protein